MKFDKKFSESSRRWLNRQKEDPYVKQAVIEGYRSRAAYKLIEIDNKFHIIKGAKRIVDIGAAPGGWSQVLSQKSCARAKIAAIDLLEFAPIDNKVRQFRGDFERDDVQKEMAEYLGNRADLVVSDMAPATSGHSQTDHLRIMGLVESAYFFSRRFLKKGGVFVAKIFQGGREKNFFNIIDHEFASTKFFKPRSSRSESVEIYVVALGYKGDSN